MGLPARDVVVRIGTIYDCNDLRSSDSPPDGDVEDDLGRFSEEASDFAYATNVAI